MRGLLLLLISRLSLGGEPLRPATSASALNLVMPGAQPKMDDSYLCSSFDVTKLSQAADPMSELHVTGFVPNADANKAHHMLLYSCDRPNQQPGVVYDCLHHSLCLGGQSIMFAWAKNAPPTTLPPGVSFTINPSVRKYLVLQIHYAHPLSEPDNTALSLTYQTDPTKYTAGIFLLLRGGLSIPPNTPVVHGDVNCKLPSNTPLHMFAYRTHAHSLSPVITGYVYNEERNDYREIARGSPQWPQAFYPMKQVQTVNPGEVVAARCTYNSTGVTHTTNIGSTAGDEMCNLYIMFFTEPGKVQDYLVCANEQEGSAITRGLPDDSDKPPQAKPDYEAHALDSSVDAGPKEINYAKLFEEEQMKSTSKKKGGLEDSTTRMAYFNLTMPGATPTREDDYLCTGVSMRNLEPVKQLWAVEFSALSSGNKAHHMIVSRCKVPVKTGEGETWDCRHHAMCKDSSKIMFAWAKHAAPTELPEDVGFQLEKDDYIVLQVHYAHPLLSPDHSGIRLKLVDYAPKYTAGMFLLLRSHLNIPPDTTGIHGDVNCQANIRSPIHVFAYRTHAHTLGSVISGYRYSPKTKEWKLLAKGNPNWPQAFYSTKSIETVNPGEILAARCTYNTTGHHTATKIGATGGDEMCNLYLMFYTLSNNDDFIVCADEQNAALTSQLPYGSDIPLPSNPALEHKASGLEETDLNYNNGAPNQNILPMPVKKGGNTVKKRPGVDTGSVKKKPGVEPNYGVKRPKELPGSDLTVVPNWPTKETEKKLGQISGVSIDIYGNAVIFHRGDRTWNGMTFKGDNTYGLDKDRPIPQDTILTVNTTGHVINSWGRNLFFLPHMITVDKKNNIWLTDVALHQVFKFPPYGGEKGQPLIALGEKFVPGSDDKHYCKPTSVAVSDDLNSFFVSDGYCNSRIIKYGVTVDPSSGNHDVKKLFEWGKGSGPFTIKQGPNSFNIPHGLALAEDRNEICVADRENGRVQCFSLDGDFTRSIKPEEFGSRIFSVAYTPANGGQLHAVSGPEFSLLPSNKKPTGYIVSMESGELSGTWNVPGGLQNPHDIAVSHDGNIVYVVELNPFKVWKLTNGAPQNLVGGSPVFPPTHNPSSSISAAASAKVSIEQLVPENMNSSVVLAAAISVPLTVIVAVCLACRRCRKRGKGTMVGSTNKSKFKDWNVGDILGRNKDGFQPVNTEERDGMLDDDSDSEVEEFSIPANHA